MTAGAGRERVNNKKDIRKKMKRNRMKKALFLVLCLTVAAAAVIGLAGCGNKQQETQSTSDGSAGTTAGTPDATTAEIPDGTTAEATGESTGDEATSVGEGAKTFEFRVTGLDGKETVFSVKTDESTVGAALVKAGLIAGEDSQYGLYVKTVNGTTLDYNKDGKYWAFYINGAYASTGVDSTQIKDGEVYSFRAE